MCAATLRETSGNCPPQCKRGKDLLFLQRDTTTIRFSSLFLLLHLFLFFVRLRWSFLHLFLFFVRHDTYTSCFHYLRSEPKRERAACHPQELIRTGEQTCQSI